MNWLTEVKNNLHLLLQDKIFPSYEICLNLLGIFIVFTGTVLE